MFTRITGLGRLTDLAAVVAALAIIAALAVKTPPGSPAGDWRAQISAPCPAATCAASDQTRA